VGLAGKLLADGERPLVVLHPHARRLLRPALVLLVLAPAAAFAAAVVPAGVARGPARLVVVALAALVTVRWVAWPFVRWWNTLYVLTDERFFERRGVVRRMGHDLPLQGVTDVMVAQRFGERLLGSGTLRITTEGGGEIVVTDVPAVSRVQRGLLAVADDITRRLRAPRRAAEELDEAEDPRQTHGDDDLDDDLYDDAYDAEDELDDVAPFAPGRGEVRRRERESRRRLAEIQAQVRRAPVTDSPVEEGGDEQRARAVDVPLPPPLLVGPDDDDGSPDDDAGGARILRFPPRT
jgi:membrane protein YdbS with pleckstrin-like domain